MKNSLRKIISLLLCLIMTVLCVGLSFISYASEYSSSQIKSEIDSILNYKMKSEGAKSLQALINGALSSQAGIGAEWYILSLVQYNSSLDFSKYRTALEKYALSGQGNPTEKEKFALLLAATGYSGSYIADTIENSTGKLGIMSVIFSLHLLNLGFTAQTVTKQSVINELLSRQLSDGGFAVSGAAGDVDTTAMTLQALSQNMNTNGVRTAIDKALSFLSSRLDENCEYSSYGAVNSESTSQTVIALSALGINACKDSRFIKNGKSLIDTLISYKQPDLGFSHIHEKGTDAYATVQALMAFVSYYRYLNSKGSLYKFSVRQQPPLTTTTTKPQTTAASTTRPQTTASQTTSASSAAQTHTSSPSTTKNNSTGGNILSGLDIFSLLTTTAPHTSVSSQPAVTSTESTSAVSALTTVASASSETASLTTAVTEITSETSDQSEVSVTESENVTEPSSENYSQVSEATSAVSISQEDTSAKKLSPFVILIPAVLLIGAFAFVIVYKKRH